MKSGLDRLMPVPKTMRKMSPLSVQRPLLPHRLRQNNAKNNRVDPLCWLQRAGIPQRRCPYATTCRARLGARDWWRYPCPNGSRHVPRGDSIGRAYSAEDSRPSVYILQGRYYKVYSRRCARCSAHSTVTSISRYFPVPAVKVTPHSISNFYTISTCHDSLK